MRDPLRHMMADRRREKFSLHLSQWRVLLYDVLRLSARREANLLYTMVAVFSIPPALENTSGENEPCSISLTRSS